MKKNLLLVMTLIAGMCIQAQSLPVGKPKEVNIGKATPVKAMKADDLKLRKADATKRMTALSVKSDRMAVQKVKEVISSKPLKNGKQLNIVRLENGMIKKQIGRAGVVSDKIKVPQPGAPAFKSPTAAAAGESVFEGWEGWDGSNPNWIPDNWTRRNTLPADTIDEFGDHHNYTWTASDGRDFLGEVLPTEGQYCGFVQYAIPDEVDNVPSDEWLISPAVDIKAGHVLKFDVFYDPFFGRLGADFDDEGEIVYNFDNVNTRVEALVSIDGGTTWTKEWDNLDEMLALTEDELWDIVIGDMAWGWTKVSVDISKYVGKQIKVAFRYWDDDGESVYLDRMIIGEYVPDPQAVYAAPSGYLTLGLSTDYGAYLPTYNFMIGNAYAPARWRAVTNDDTQSVSWNFDGLGNTNELNPLVTYPCDMFDMPTIIAKNGSITNSWQWDAAFSEENYLFSGGAITDYVRDPVGAGNYDLNYQFTAIRNLNAEDLAKMGIFLGAANYFEKPAAKFMFETFYVHCGDIEAKLGEPVKLIIRKVDDRGKVGDIIATSEAYPNDFILVFSEGETNYYTIPFTFKAVDPETGLEEDSFLEIETAFIVEFVNYKSAKVWIQYGDHPSGYNYAHVVFEGEEGEEGNRYERINPRWSTSFLFDMDAIFPFLHAADNRYEAPAGGGTKNFLIDTYWLPIYEGESQWWTEEELPSWIRFGNITIDSKTGVATLPVTVDPLPNGITGRNTDIKISSYGCDMTLKFRQGDSDFTGIPAITSKTFNAVRQGDNFLLSYPEGTVAVDVYSISGQKTATHLLNNSGTGFIPTSNWPAGIYILKFTGKASGVLKVVK